MRNGSQLSPVWATPDRTKRFYTRPECKIGAILRRPSEGFHGRANGTRIEAFRGNSGRLQILKVATKRFYTWSICTPLAALGGTSKNCSNFAFGPYIEAFRAIWSGLHGTRFGPISHQTLLNKARDGISVIQKGTDSGPSPLSIWPGKALRLEGLEARRP